MPSKLLLRLALFVCSVLARSISVARPVAQPESREPGTQATVRRAALAVALAQGQWGFGVRGQATPPPRPPLRQWWEDPGLIGGASTMMGTGVHVVDLLRFLLQQEIAEVAAISDGQRSQQPLEQLLAMSLRFDRGTIATVCCGRRLPDSRNDFDLYGNITSTMLGEDWSRPKRRFPGSFGSAYLYFLVPRVILFTREDYRTDRSRLFSIDVTGYNEREVPTPLDASDANWSNLVP